MGFIKLLIIINLVCLTSANAQMKPIVGGNLSKIEDFPYIAFLSILCDLEHSTEYYGCGASIVNELILLTAGHCFENCMPTTIIKARVGSANRRHGSVYFSTKFKIHEDYRLKKVINDIALVKLKRKLKFGKHVQRIGFMLEPPYFEPAVVAGWGITDEKYRNGTDRLMHINQKVWHRQSCLDAGFRLPRGAFCAGNLREIKHAASGDSGSPLVVLEFIQIGLVSFKNRRISDSLVVYTDTGHYFNWISKETRKLFCFPKKCDN